MSLSGAKEALDHDGRWGLLRLMSFRLAASYLILSWLTVYGIFQVIPLVGYRLDNTIAQLWNVPVHWVGLHVFHLAGIAAQFHPSDSRDTALDWIAACLTIPATFLVALVWSLLDRKRSNYRIAAEWLRYVLRLALVFLMLRYALMKIFPLQMPAPSLAVLNEPVGNTSPMTLLWTAIGLHPGYEMVGGWIEAAAAFLLIFRRTALLGALLTIVVMANVLLYNLFFDVPVKLGAANVLILAVAVMGPDLATLWRIFVLQQSGSFASRWAPLSGGRVGKVGMLAGELFFVFCALIQFVPVFAQTFRTAQANIRHPSYLTGEWHVDSVIREDAGKKLSMPVLTGFGKPMTEITFEPSGTVMARAADGMLWRAQAEIDLQRQTLTLDSGYFDADRFTATYAVTSLEINHLVLTPVGDAAHTNGVMILSRIPLPARYPLLEQRFHWVNEWALER